VTGLASGRVDAKRVEIRWSDVDALGHVNNAVYLTYLEEVRDEWLTGVLAGAGDPTGFVLARVAIDFRRELVQADDLCVGTCRATRVGTSSVTTREELRRLDGELAAEAESVLVARDGDSGRSRPLSADERLAFERALAA
jgi:acyl-CoA thioester hydrolase